MHAPTPQGIATAATRIDPLFLNMPMLRSAAIDRRFDAEIWFKDETANPIRSFKGRGTSNFVAKLPARAPLVCASAGNFGQGLAWASRSAGIPLTVFVAHGAVACKVEAIRAFGVDLRQAGHDFDAAKDAARAFAVAEGQAYVEDGAEATIAEGAGTIALELTSLERFDDIIVPLGNGALASGVGTWMRQATPATTVVAVAAQGAPAMADAVRTGRAVPAATADTIADGIAVRVPIPYAVECVRRVVDEILLVDDESIRAAMALLADHLGRTVEPAGAAGLAAILAEPARWCGRRIAIPLCGGNVDPPTAAPSTVTIGDQI